ncbi:MAG: glycoside hydrolase family 13 protein [Breznakibacter sp.]
MKQLRTIAALAVMLCATAAMAQKTAVTRVEPLNWWVGMSNPDLQMMVYGPQIASCNVSVNYDGVTLKHIVKVPNPNYLFLDLSIAPTAKAGKMDIVFTSGKKTVATYAYELKERQPGSAERKGFNSSDVIYLIMPDRFANGNPANDNHPDVFEKADRTSSGGRHGGDIQGIINHLDYIKELGATAIWCTPLTVDNEKSYSYHGYASSDQYNIDPRYGTNDDYAKLGNELHRRHMKLIMDYVTNHWGAAHWLIQDLPSRDWIHYWEKGENGFQRSNYRMTSQFDDNASKADADGCMDGWFDTTMPDMNQRNPMVINYMVQNAIWWIEYAGLDGLRVDTYSYNDKHGIAEWTKRVMDEYPNLNIVGKIWMHDQAQISYWQKDSKIAAIQSFNSYLPSVMDFTLHDAIMQCFNETDQGWDRGMIRVYDNFANDFLYPDINNILVFAANHDTQRLQTVFGNDFDKYKLAMALIATVRGTPQLYYGDEIGMEGDKSKGDGDIRRDFPGGWPNDTQNAFVASGRTELQNRYFDFAKKLLNWRKNKEVIHNGKTLHYVPEDNVYVYFRYNDTERVMVVLNNSGKEQDINTNRFAEGIGQAKHGTDILSGKTVSLENAIKVQPKSPLILELTSQP